MRIQTVKKQPRIFVLCAPELERIFFSFVFIHMFFIVFFVFVFLLFSHIVRYVIIISRNELRRSKIVYRNSLIEILKYWNGNGKICTLCTSICKWLFGLFIFAKLAPFVFRFIYLFSVCFLLFTMVQKNGQFLKPEITNKRIWILRHN